MLAGCHSQITWTAGHDCFLQSFLYIRCHSGINERWERVTVILSGLARKCWLSILAAVSSRVFHSHPCTLLPRFHSCDLHPCTIFPFFHSLVFHSCVYSVPNFTLPDVHLAPPLEFRRDLWRQKTRIHGLSYSIVFFEPLVQYRIVTDERPDRGMDARPQHIPRYSIASRGKKSALLKASVLMDHRRLADEWTGNNVQCSVVTSTHVRCATVHYGIVYTTLTQDA